MVFLERHDQRASVELVILLRLSNNIKGLELQHPMSVLRLCNNIKGSELQRPMSEVCRKCLEVRG